MASGKKRRAFFFFGSLANVLPSVCKRKKSKKIKKKLQKKSPAKIILKRKNPPFPFSYSPLMKNWGFVSHLEKVCLGSTIAKFLPGPLGKKFLMAGTAP